MASAVAANDEDDLVTALAATMVTHVLESPWIVRAQMELTTCRIGSGVSGN